MSDQIIPLTNQPNQTFQVVLSVDGGTIRLNLLISYDEMANYWTMGISDSNNNPLVIGIPLVTGDWPSANVLGQYGYLGIGSAYVLNLSNNNNLDYPNSSTLGTEFALLWSDTAP